LRATAVALAPQRRRKGTEGGVARGRSSGPKSTLFDVVMQAEAEQQARRSGPSRSPRTDSANVSGRAASGPGKRPVVVRNLFRDVSPEVPSAGDAPRQPSFIATTPQPSSTPSLTDTLLGRAGRTPPAGPDRVVLAPLTPHLLRTKRRPKSTRQRALDVQQRQALGADPEGPVSRTHHRVEVAAAEASSYSQRNVSKSEMKALAAVFGGAVGVFALTALVMWPTLRGPRQDRASAQLKAELEAELSVASKRTPESESEVDRRAVIGADPLVPASMMGSFATPYWQPSAAEVVAMLEARAAPLVAAASGKAPAAT